MEESLQQRQRRYWRRNLRLTIGLLVVWFVVTYVAAFYARELNDYVLFSFPLGFYMGAQGALLIYLCIVGWYARRMNQLDRDFEQSTPQESHPKE